MCPKHILTRVRVASPSLSLCFYPFLSLSSSILRGLNVEPNVGDRVSLSVNINRLFASQGIGSP